MAHTKVYVSLHICSLAPAATSDGSKRPRDCKSGWYTRIQEGGVYLREGRQTGISHQNLAGLFLENAPQAWRSGASGPRDGQTPSGCSLGYAEYVGGRTYRSGAEET